MFHLYVNGNLVHDEGEHDADGRVIRSGGGPLTFMTKAEGDSYADKLHAEVVSRFELRLRRMAPGRECYVVSEVDQ